MLSDYIKPGDRVELSSAEFKSKQAAPDKRSGRIYYSKVFDIRSDDEIEIVIPMEGGRLTPLTRNSRYDIWIYDAKGLYHGTAIASEYLKKKDSVAVLLLELTNGLKKLQRREYYRFSCLLGMKCRKLTAEEEEQFSEGIIELLDTDMTLEDGIIVDISGGGARCLLSGEYNTSDLIQFEFKLPIDPTDPKEYSLIGRVVTSNPAEGRKDKNEVRIEFLNIRSRDREGIVKYIFEEERRLRGKNR